MRVSLLFIALASCGDNRVAGLDGVRSGTRLVLVRDIYADGSEAIAKDRFFDQELGTECRPTRWSDGRTYCTPEAGATVFIDAGCERSVGQVPQGENGFPPEPRFFVRMFRLGEQPYPSRLYATGYRVATPSRIYEQRDGICFGPFAPGVVANYYFLHDVSAVGLHEREVIADERFALAVMVSEDGLATPTGWTDRKHGFSCRPDGDPDADEVPCVPTRAESATAYLDSQCKTPAVLPVDGAALIARYIDPATRCTTYHPIGEASDLLQVYLRLGERCVAVDVPRGKSYRLDEAFAVAPIARERIDTGHRLHALVSSAGVLRIVDDEHYDMMLATACRPALVEGAVRCVPNTTTESRVYFTDEDCTSQIVLARVEANTCASTRFAQDSDGTPRALGEAYGGPVFTVLAGGACVRTEPGAATFLVAGEPLVDELATVSYVSYDL